MDSWWQLGEEWAGLGGKDLSTGKIQCAFCTETGNFEKVSHFEKKKPNGNKKLNFDTLKCGACHSFVLVMWSAEEHSERMHDIRVLPWPLKVSEFPKHWPEAVGRYWLQAKRNLKDENWDAAALMARGALQVALRDHNAKGKNLAQEIEDLAARGLLPPVVVDWSHEVRELGNDSAHPRPSQEATNPQDAKDVVRFLDSLLEYLYTLPHRIKEYRDRRAAGNAKKEAS